MIDAIIHNLKDGIALLQCLEDAQYCDSSVAPYNSCIGNHMRHILDVYDCVLDGLDSGEIDLTARKRNPLIERSPRVAKACFAETITQVRSLAGINMDRLVSLKDDMGLGMVETKTTVGAILMQANSHTLHHYASLGYIISQLDLDLPCSRFGFNPTTPACGAQAG